MIKSKIPLPGKRPAQSSIPLPTKNFGTQSKKLPLNPKEVAVSKKLVSKQPAPSNSSKVRENQENIVKRLPWKSHDSKKDVVLNKRPLYNALDVNKVSISKVATENTLIKQKKPVPARQLPKIIVSKPEPEPKKENRPRRFSSLISHNGKNSVLTNNKPRTIIKSAIQTKPVSVRQLPKITAKSEHEAKKENLPRRFSSLTPHNRKTSVLSNNKPRTIIKSAFQTKGINPTEKLNKISKNNIEQDTNANLSTNKNEERADGVPSMNHVNAIAKSGVDDSEFKDSHFFKSLILNQRELSPGIIKCCSKAKLLSPKDNLPQKASLHFLTADEFVEEVKRLSSKYHRINGRLVLLSPFQLKQRKMSAQDFVEEVKRNSARFQQSKRNLIHTPSIAQKSLLRRMAPEGKENLDIKLVDEVRRLSEFRKQSLQNGDFFMANRRWTCNVSSKPLIANMNPTELAAELHRVSEIRRESGAQIYKNTPFLEQHYSAEKLNPHQKVLREIECLTAKKKERAKKKVTFSIPSPGSPQLAGPMLLPAKAEAKLSDISEGSSHVSTPEFDLGCGKVKTSSQSGANSAENTSVITTPELNLTSYKLDFNASPKEINTTLPFDVLHKNYTLTNDDRTDSLKTNEEDFEKNSEQCSQNPIANSINSKSDFLSSKFSSLKIINNNVGISEETSDDASSFRNYMTSTNSNSYSEFFHLKSTDCLFPSVNRLAVSTIHQPVNETEKFIVNETGQFIVNETKQFCVDETVKFSVNETEKFSVKTEKKIYTPHPFNLHSKSTLPPSVSPSFLSQKSSTLNSLAPICTPMVLRNLSHSPEVNLNQIRQKLDFNEKPNCFIERRESQIILQTIPTVQKMNDFLCDQECIILSSQGSEEDAFIRNLENPISFILNNGDEMHFIPISSP